MISTLEITKFLNKKKEIINNYSNLHIKSYAQQLIDDLNNTILFFNNHFYPIIKNFNNINLQDFDNKYNNVRIGNNKIYLLDFFRNLYKKFVDVYIYFQILEDTKTHNIILIIGEAHAINLINILNNKKLDSEIIFEGKNKNNYIDISGYYDSYQIGGYYDKYLKYKKKYIYLKNNMN